MKLKLRHYGQSRQVLGRRLWHRRETANKSKALHRSRQVKDLTMAEDTEGILTSRQR